MLHKHILEATYRSLRDTTQVTQPFMEWQLYRKKERAHSCFHSKTIVYLVINYEMQPLEI